MALTAATARDLILISPGLTDDSAVYKIYLENTESSEIGDLKETKISMKYLNREKLSGWYTDSVLSGPSYLTQITSADCRVKTPYFFSSEYTGKSADIVIARSAYPDPTKALGSGPSTILDRLGVRKNKRGEWEIKFLSEKILEKYYCSETEIIPAVYAYERSALGHSAKTESQKDVRGQK